MLCKQNQCSQQLFLRQLTYRWVLKSIKTEMQNYKTLQNDIHEVTLTGVVSPHRCKFWELHGLGLQERDPIRLRIRAAWHRLLRLPPARGTDQPHLHRDYEGCEGHRLGPFEEVHWMRTRGMVGITFKIFTQINSLAGGGGSKHLHMVYFLNCVVLFTFRV